MSDVLLSSDTKRRRVMPSRVSYRPLIVGAYEYYQKEMLNELVNLKPKTHYQAVTNQVKTKQKNYGDVRLANIRKYMDHIKGYDRSEMQKQFHESFLQVSLYTRLCIAKSRFMTNSILEFSLFTCKN